LGSSKSGNFTGPRGHRPKRDTNMRQLNLGYVDESLYFLVKFEAIKSRTSLSKWVQEAMRKRLERDVLSKD